MKIARFAAITLSVYAGLATIVLGVKLGNAARELTELKLAQPVLAACPIPPLDSPQSLIIWRTRDGIGGEEIRCTHGRIRAADPRAVGPARPGSAS